MLADSLDWTYAFAPLSIIICILIVAMHRSVTPSNVFAMISSMACAAILLTLFLPSEVKLFSCFISAGIWFLYAFAVTISVWCGSFEDGRSVKKACFYIACVFSAAAVSNIAAYVFPVQDSTLLVIVAVLLAFSLALALASGNTSASRYAEGPAAFDSGDACRAIARAKDLTERECDVFCLLAKGYSLKSIAEKLYVSENTVKSHRRRIYLKLGINSRQELIDLVEASEEAPSR